MDKRDQIINAAIELFAEQGFDKTSISAICEKVGVSKGLVFHHFKNKDDLLREVFIKITDIVRNAGERSPAITDPKARIVAYIESIFAAMSVPDYRVLYQLNFSVMVQPNTRALLLDLIEERVLFMRQATEEVFDYIGHKNSAIVSQMFVAEIDGIALNYLFSAEEFPIDEIKTEFIKKYT